MGNAWSAFPPTWGTAKSPVAWTICPRSWVQYR